MNQNSFIKGFRDGIPIGLGYVSVSIAFGITAVGDGLPVWGAVLISMTNLTSAGQLAGVGLIAAQCKLLELVLSQLVINMRYALMSISVSQKVDKTVSGIHRFLVSFFITDEIFAIICDRKGSVGKRYLYGLGLSPFLGWSFGTFLGALLGEVLPPAVNSALGIAMYGMFIAIVVPAAMKNRRVILVAAISALLSCILKFVPLFSAVSAGFSIIICAVAASAIGAVIFPVKEEEQ